MLASLRGTIVIVISAAALVSAAHSKNLNRAKS